MVWSEGNGSIEEAIGKRVRKWRKIYGREETKAGKEMRMRRRRRIESGTIGRRGVESEKKRLEGGRKMWFYT